jgi:DNA polymerase I
MESRKPAGDVLVLIDGHSLAFRAFHALPPNLATSRGELTNAVFGFVSMLLNVLRDIQPTYIGVAFDVGRTFRHEQYPEYKANRAKTPEEIIYQVERIKEILGAMRIPTFSLEGYEADDVIGTLSRQAEETGVDTLIVTGDTDAFQLIDARVRVMTSGRRFSDTVVYDAQAIRERYGLSPSQLIDFKALTGDKSDNIPGVAGVGEKTAAALLQQYGSLDEIFAHLDEISSKRAREALGEQRELAFNCRDLVRIVRDAPIELDWDASRFGQYDRDTVIRLFRELEQPVVVSAGLGEYTIIDTAQSLEQLTRDLRAASVFAVDTETTSTRAMQAELVGISLAFAPGRGAYIPVGHVQGRQMPLERVRDALRPLFMDGEKAKVAHNAIYDLMILRRHDFDVHGPLFDTMIAEWLIDPASQNLGLKNLAWARLGVEMTPITQLIGSGKNQDSMANVEVGRAGPYAAADADMTLRLHQILSAELKEKRLWPLFSEVEMPLIPVLAEMEMAGIKVDADLLATMSAELEERMRELERMIQDTVGYGFNIRSTQQLSNALFTHLGLPTQGLRKTAAGTYSTSADVLEGLRSAHPVIEMILEHRQLAKLKSTYLDALPSLINPRTRRVHTSLNQTGTVTGRVSSSDPNLQNIPIRTALGRQVREAFVAEKGMLLLSADYSQVELRILAHISEDPAMLAAFARGEDIHAFTASQIYHIPLDGVTPEMRRIAKTTNFAIVYGVTGYGLSQQTSLSQSEANEFIKAYFEQYPQVKAYLDRCKAQAAQLGYVETLLGRRRYFPELQSEQRAHAGLRAAAERMAINMPIQGTAADIIKIAMIRLQGELKRRGLRARMLLQVHDELLLEVPESEMVQVPDLVESIMEGAYILRAPLKVDRRAGPNWGQMESC